MVCTKFFIEQWSDPIIQQTTYCSYYGPTTFKILVACTEKGETIYYVFDVYGGSIQDRKITADSGILVPTHRRRVKVASLYPIH